jgi:hypothetical protein
MRSYKLVVSRRVMVNLTTGSAIQGILWDEKGPLIVLRDAQLHNEGGHAPLDGEVIIERDRIEFVQVVT